MKNIYVAEVTNRQIKAFNDAKAAGFHMPFISPTMMSSGTKSIFWCPKQLRSIFTLSEGEKRFYLTKIYSPNVISIKEQYPLDYTKTRDIADTLDVIHPRDHVTGKLEVMTTDFVILYRNNDGTTYREAYWFKPQEPIRNRTRAKQKCDIEERYWKRLDVRYNIVIGSRHVCHTQAANYQMLCQYYDVNVDVTALTAFTDTFLNSISAFPTYTLKSTLLDTAERLNMPTTKGYFMFANALLRHILPIDLHQTIELAAPARLHKRVLPCSV